MEDFLKNKPNLLELVKNALNKHPDKTAFISMGVFLSFKEIDELSDKFAYFLQDHLKVQKGDKVALQLPNILQYPICLIGCLKIGATLVNINPLYTHRETAKRLQDSEAKVLIICSLFSSQLKEIKSTYLKHTIITDFEDLFPKFKALVIRFVLKYIKKRLPDISSLTYIPFKQTLLKKGRLKKVSLSPNDLLSLQYTGGTTGISKGVMLTHKNILANVYQMKEHIKGFLDENDSIITPLPLYHSFSFTVNLILSLEMTWTNILVSNPRDLKSFISDLKKYKPQIITGINTLFKALNNQASFKKIDFHFKACIAGGAPLEKAVGLMWEKITGCAICEGYGLTECSPVVAANSLKNPRYESIGRALKLTEIKIINENGESLGENLSGELCVKGPQVMQAYFKKKEETDQVLKNSWLHTGDIAQIDSEGFIKIIDRKKDMILVSGFNVYPNEIEQISCMHEKVLEACCVGVPDDESGEVPKLFVVSKEASLSEEELLEFLKTKLTRYKIPKYIEFKKSLPKNPIGKILRKELR